MADELKKADRVHGATGAGGTIRIEQPVNKRLARMRFLSRLLDNSILLPGGYRIGLDPLLGLLPGAGDFISGTLSVWLIYDAARLGLPWTVLGRMLLNVLFDTAAGSVPVAGDLFDAVWKSNAKNMRLAEQHYHPRMKERSFRLLALAFAAVLLAVYALLGLAIYSVVKAFLSLF